MTNLLNTRATNLLKLIWYGEIYWRPPSLHGYSWKEAQWEDLWNDLIDFRGKLADRYSHLTIKKIPKTVLSRCEWGHDDYSLKIENLPKAPTPPGQQGLELDISWSWPDT